MAIVLGPLLATFSSAMRALWRARMQNPVSHLLPDWADPGMPDPVLPAESGSETVLRRRLMLCAEQMRAIGPASVVREILRRGSFGLAPGIILAAPGFAPWQAQAAIPWAAQSRRSADGMTYVLQTAIAGGAAHAEHAALSLSQRLFVSSDEGEATPSLAVAVASLRSHCLSLACALRDVDVWLRQDGEHALASELALRSGLDVAMQADHAAQQIPEPLWAHRRTGFRTAD